MNYYKQINIDDCNFELPDTLKHTSAIQALLPLDVMGGQKEAAARPGRAMVKAIESSLQAIEGINKRKGDTELIERQLSNLKKFTLECINANHQEYKTYCREVNASKNTQDKGKRKSAAKKAGDMERKRGAKHSADMLKKLTVTHVRLTNNLEKIYSELDSVMPDDVKEWLSAVQLDIAVPDIPLSQKNREKYLTLDTVAHGSSSSMDIVFKAQIGPVSVAVEAKKIHVKGDINPDMNGEFLKLSVRSGLGGKLVLSEKDAKKIAKKLMGEMPDINIDDTVLVDVVSDADALLEGEGFHKIEVNLVKCHDDCYRPMYVRNYVGKKLGAKGTAVAPIAPGVALEADVAVAKYNYHVLREDLGTSTIHYVTTIYNGSRLGLSNERWEALKKTPNKAQQLGKIMRKIAKPTSYPAHEFNDECKELIGAYCTQEQVTEWEKALLAFRESTQKGKPIDTSSDAYKRSMSALEEFLAANFMHQQGNLKSKITLKTR